MASIPPASTEEQAQNGAAVQTRNRCAIEAALAAAALLFFRIFPAPAAPSLRACPFYWMTALPCPLCGITRGLCAAAKGEWAQAVEFHALSPLFLLALLLWFAVSIGRILGFDFWQSRWTRWREASVLVLAYGVLRVAARTL